MKLICKDVKNRDESIAFITSCEVDFECKLRQASKEILNNRNRVITLSGPSCSGKTTTASMLVDVIEKSGHRAVVVSIDDFYLDNLREGLGENKEIDFDSVNTIDLKCLKSFTEDILSGKTTKIPVFDFKTGLRSAYREFVPSEGDIYIYEGIQAVYPEVTSIIKEDYTSVFICVEDDVICNGVYFSAHEVRLLRRIVRDYKFRNTIPEHTLMIWDSVRANEETSIFPNAKNPHFFIDSFLIYEIFMIAPIALPLLKTIPLESPYKSVSDSLSRRLESLVSEWYFPSDIPEGSMFREFIGNMK